MGGIIPDVQLNSGRSMPAVGLGTASFPLPEPEAFRSAILDAITLGYRHFDTAATYSNEQHLGEALAEAVEDGLVGTREELFITSKLWCTDAHPGRVLPALQRSLQNLQLEYLDLYLIHWPASLKPGDFKFPLIKDQDFMPMDVKSVWKEMEECQRLGLTKSIGVSNFSSKKLDDLLRTAEVPPSVNQVELHPIWQQKKLFEFCNEKRIHVSAYSPLGGFQTPWGNNLVMECNVLKEIATTRGKSVAQISLRWIYEQGSSLIVKSFRKERMNENINIFGWELSTEELQKISRIQQCKIIKCEEYVSAAGPFTSLDELWDGEI